VLDAEYAEQYPEDVGAYEAVGEAEEGETVGAKLYDGEMVEGLTDGTMVEGSKDGAMVEGSADGAIAELPE
jgi:hypothetical protein